ncbi:MAG: sigma 54 modulation/S30EA ribosomal C-terminal domain-containing protein [Bryobacterales bacterium]|nr:sigma 54 modulation/S30EA ribosomal C-terminal domain-containing protein [Bryobacterales bacterium]
MRIDYSGLKAALSDRDRSKLQRKLFKIQRILTRRGELQSQIRLSRQRHLCAAEVTLRAKRHTLVVAGTGSTPFLATLGALDKLEKQAIRHRRKIIDTHRPGRQRDSPSPLVELYMRQTGAVPQSTVEPPDRSPRIVRSVGIEPKPMTPDEALLLLEGGRRDFVPYRDATTGKVSVLVRRRDGDAELVEGD